MIAYLDLETCSKADLKEVGAYRYACDPSTKVLMAGVSTDQADAPVHLWVHPEMQTEGMVSDLKALEILRNADLVYAHNAAFEAAILWGTKFMDIPISKWRCTQAMARVAALPESLEKCAESLQILNKKSREGKALIELFSIGLANPQDHVDEWVKFGEYCKQDVKVERDIHAALGKFELKGQLLKSYLLTMRINERGVPVNVAALNAAKKVLLYSNEALTAEFVKLVNFNPTQRAKMQELLLSEGVEVDSMSAASLAVVNRDKLTTGTRRALDIYSLLSYSAAKKVYTMLDWVCPDGRMRGIFKFYGAGTGRWSAGGPQVQNAKKAIGEAKWDTTSVYAYLCSGKDPLALTLVYDNSIEVIANCIRYFISGMDVKSLDGDYNAIEARISCWVANDLVALEEYKNSIDRYKQMAADIYDVPVSSITKDQRELGKRAILGLGYGMGSEKFKNSCGMDITLELAEKAKESFRKRHVNIVMFWKELESGMRYAISTGCTQNVDGRIMLSIDWAGGIKYLLVQLPSGRKLAYPNPSIESLSIPHRTSLWPTVTYWGQVKTSTQWGRILLYGAKLFENICQGIAADIMSHGASCAEDAGMHPYALIHDQALALAVDGKTPEQFSQALETIPEWAKGLPLKVESKLVSYYSK
tara:strand:+ start:7345 stop:9282 length:1938 start_codon:yes stop_codon:yes gene_type:complete